MPRPLRTCCYDVSVIVAMLSAGLNIGLSLGLLGPTLPDLALQTRVSLTTASTLATWRSIAYIIGALFSGILLDNVDGFLGLSVVLLLQAATTSFAGWFSDFATIAFFQAASNFFSTIIISGVPFLIFRLKRSKARMVAQAAFLLFNVGKALVPLIVAPFLNSDNKGNATNPDFITTMPPLNFSEAIIRWGPEDLLVAEPVTHVGWAYVIVGAYCLLMFCLYAGIAMANGCQWRAKKISETTAVRDEHVVETSVNLNSSVERNDYMEKSDCTEKFLPAECSDHGSPPAQSKAGHNTHTDINRAPIHSTPRMTAIILTFMLGIFMQSGMEMVDNTLLLSFAMEYMHLSKVIGLILTSLYQGIKVIVCIGIMFLVNRVHPSTILLTDIICMVLASCTMIATVLVNDEVTFFIAIIVLAIGMSNFYATILSWLEGYYPITGRLSSLISVFFGVSGMALTPLTSILLETYGAVAFPVVLVVSSVMCLVIWGVIKVILRKRFCSSFNVSGAADENTPLLVDSE